ncbi:MAG: DUF2087 domain-containing protein [Candidatus Rifleibacteriota bacterium]
MNNLNIYFDASIDEMTLGLREEKKAIVCLICGREFEKGRVFREKDQYFDAPKMAEKHIEEEHGGIFKWLLSLDKKLNGLSEHQSQLLQLFFQKLTDQQIQQKLKIGSASTVRNHRFAFREKERQAKIYLILMNLLHEKESEKIEFIKPHETATMVDDRYKVTADETEKILKKLFPEGLDNKLKTFAVKEKSKVVVLRHIAQRFETGKIYTEKQINSILKDVYDDYVMLRRYLIEYGFIDREPDGSRYWLKQ